MKKFFSFSVFLLVTILFAWNSMAQGPNTWTRTSDLGFNIPNSPPPRSEGVGFSVGNKGFVGLGYDGTNYLNDFWEYDPVADLWTQKANFQGGQRGGAVAFGIGSFGYVGTGFNANGQFKDFWKYDTAANTWQAKSDFQGGLRKLAVGFSINNKGYIGTGQNGSGTSTKDFWEYDPAGDTWTQKTNFGGAQRFSAAGFNVGSKGYIGTGFDSTSRNSPMKKDFWEYDPSANTWTQKADFGGSARAYAVGLGVGPKGYLGVGYDNNHSYRDFWEYNPSNNTWTQITIFPGIARAYAVGFCIGNIGYVGTGSYTVDFYAYDPSAGTWSRKENLGGIYEYEEAGFSIGGKGYIVGRTTSDFWEYDTATNAWTQKVGFAGTVRIGPVGFSINDKGYIGTGQDNNGYEKDFWEYNSSSNSWTRKADFGGTPRIWAAGFSIGSKGYIGTGQDYNGHTKDFWEYDQSTDTWTRKADFGGTPRWGAVGFGIGNKGYMGTGYNNDHGLTNDLWEYDPSTNSWTEKADLGLASRYDGVGFSIGTKGYIGTGYNGFLLKDFWEFDPSANTWTRKADFGGTERMYAVGFSIGTKGYIGTGYDTHSAKKDFWEYNAGICTPPPMPANTTPSANQNICIGNSTTLSASGTGTLGWYDNAIGGNWLADGPDFTTPELYSNTSFYVQDSTCMPSTLRRTITVTVNPYQVPGLTGPAVVCAFDPGNTYTTQTGMTNYAWSVSTGGVITAGGDPSSNFTVITWNKPGQQSVSVNYSNAQGCSAPSPTVYNVTVNPLPIPSVGGPTGICVNSGPYSYSTEQGMANYTWSISTGGTIVSGQNTSQVQVSWNSQGSRWVAVNYTNGFGCTAAAPSTLYVTVTDVPAAAGIISGPLVVCAGAQEVAYSVAPVPNAIGYLWTLPSGAIIASGFNTNNITVNFGSNAVTGNIFVAGTNACGTGNSSPNFLVEVNPLPSAAGPVNGPTSVCSGAQNIPYSVAAIPNAAGYSWSLPAGSMIESGENTNAITVNFGTVSGYITVEGTNSCGNGMTSPPLSVTVNPTPFTPVVTANGNKLISSETDGNQWYRDGASVQGATGQTYIVPADKPGWYWTVVTLMGCSSDPSNRVYVQGVGIEEKGIGNIIIYPVPDDGRFSIGINSGSEITCELEIYNELGVKFFCKQTVPLNRDAPFDLDLRPVPAGIYTVVIHHEGRVDICKIIVVR
jgi:hypothetical protein